MFGIGTTEFLVILLVAVLVLGPEHLPKIMRTVTKVMSDFRRVSTDFQRTINLEANQEEWQREQAAKKTRKKKKPKPAPDIAAEDAVPAREPGEPVAQRPGSAPDDVTTAAQDKSAPDITAEDAAPSREPGEPPLQGGSA